MSSTTVAPPVWRMTLASMFPAALRDRAMTIAIDKILLAGVLAVQAGLSLRLSNSPFQDEALYLYYGHWIRSAWDGGEAVYTHPEAFFSGAPQLYPVFASYLDDVGGVELARLFSLLCMLVATVAVFALSKALFAPRYGAAVGLFAAVAFSLSAPVIFIGNLATFDAPSFACIAGAAALSAWSATGHRSVWWSLPIGLLAALAVALKYASAIDLPFALLLTLVGIRLPRFRVRAVARAAVAGGVTLAALGISALTWARSDLAGLRMTTLERHMDAYTAPWTLIRDVASWSGVTLVIMLAGGVLLARHRPVLAALLGAGTLTAMAMQIHAGDLTSLHKHVTLGLIFGAPLAGVALCRLRQVKLGTLMAAALVWIALMVGLDQSRGLFLAWPNTTGLVQTIEPSIAADPTIRMVGDIPEPVEYALRRQTQPWQWTGTYAGSLGYHGLTGVAAYRAALKANYFQLAFFDGSSEVSRTLTPEMPALGFHRTGTILTRGATWTIWQRFDSVSN